MRALYRSAVPLIYCCLAVVPIYQYCAPAPTALERLRRQPNVQVSFYDVVGSSSAELRQSLRAKGPRTADGRPMDAHTSWRIDWKWPRDNGRPVFSDTEASYRAVVRLPRWIPESAADPQLIAAWHAYLENLINHELVHVGIARDNFKRASDAVRAAARQNPRLTAAEANLRARRELARIRRLDHEYDRQTRHGRLEGVRLD